MVRDRTHEMKIMIGEPLEVRNSVRRPRSSQKPIDEAFEKIDRIEESVGLLSKAHKEVLSSVPSKTTTRIDEIVDEVQHLASSVKDVIVQLQRSVNKEDKTVDGRRKYSQHQALSKRFSDAIFQFNEEQLRYRESCKKQIQIQMEVSGQPVSDKVLEDMLEKGNVFAGETSQVAIEEARIVVDEVKARHRDIIKLEESIQHMKQLFVDIANMIQEQGVLIDVIEVHVGGAADHVSHGQKDLEKAEKSQKSARRKKLYCLAFVVILITIIIIVVAVVK